MDTVVHYPREPWTLGSLAALLPQCAYCKRVAACQDQTFHPRYDSQEQHHCQGFCCRPEVDMQSVLQEIGMLSLLADTLFQRIEKLEEVAHAQTLIP